MTRHIAITGWKAATWSHWRPKIARPWFPNFEHELLDGRRLCIWTRDEARAYIGQIEFSSFDLEHLFSETARFERLAQRALAS